MPHTPSAAKRMRQFAKRNLYNRSVESAVKTAVKRLQAAVKAGDAAKVQPVLRETLGVLDKARLKGVMHRNTVARRKSSMERLAATAGKTAEEKKA